MGCYHAVETTPCRTVAILAGGVRGDLSGGYTFGHPGRPGSAAWSRWMVSSGHREEGEQDVTRPEKVWLGIMAGVMLALALVILV